MQQTKNEHSIYGGWRPKRFIIDNSAPFYDWLLIMRCGRTSEDGTGGRIQWGDHMRPSQIGSAITYLLGVTEAKGLCGKIVGGGNRNGQGCEDTK